MLLYLFDNDIEIQLGFYNLIHDNKRFNDIMVIIFCISPVKKSTLFTKFVKSFSNFQISDARCFVQKFTQTFFFFWQCPLPLSKGQLPGFVHQNVLHL